MHTNRLTILLLTPRFRYGDLHRLTDLHEKAKNCKPLLGEIVSLLGTKKKNITHITNGGQEMNEGPTLLWLFVVATMAVIGWEILVYRILMKRKSETIPELILDFPPSRVDRIRVSVDGKNVVSGPYLRGGHLVAENFLRGTAKVEHREYSLARQNGHHEIRCRFVPIEDRRVIPGEKKVDWQFAPTEEPVAWDWISWKVPYSDQDAKGYCCCRAFSAKGRKGTPFGARRRKKCSPCRYEQFINALESEKSWEEIESVIQEIILSNRRGTFPPSKQ